MLNKRLEHFKRHELLHDELDELVADFITHTKLMPSRTTISVLLNWSYEQTENPTEVEVCHG